MNKAPLIVWEKWVDPLGLEQENQYEENFYDEEEEDIDSPDSDHHMNEFDESKKPPKSIRVVSTPMGFIPMDQTMPAGKIFNFWMGHTNFNITKPIAYIIEKTDGVETLDIYTRYRFRVGFGKLFEDGEIMREINSKVYEYLS
jgi:hypothetical protein